MKAEEFPRYHYRASVIRVIDGDTVEARISLGCRAYLDRHVRIIGYNAPELHGASHEAGAIAKDALTRLIPPGSDVYLRTQLDRSSFERLLAVVMIPDLESTLVDVSSLMISMGYAT